MTFEKWKNSILSDTLPHDQHLLSILVSLKDLIYASRKGNYFLSLQITAPGEG